MFYIIEENFTTTNKKEYADKNIVYIQTTPLNNRWNDREITDGFACSTQCQTHDIAYYAHGEYETLGEARQALKARFSSAKTISVTDYDYADLLNGSYVEVYNADGVHVMNYNDATDWIYETMQRDITTETSDEELRRLAAQYESDANAEGWSLGGINTVVDILNEYREGI